MNKARQGRGLGLALAASLACMTSQAAPVAVKSAPADADFFTSASFHPPVGLVDARQVQDVDGRHILVLSRTLGPSREQPKAGPEGRIDLRVTYYDERPFGWREAWTIKDSVDCPDLDMEGKFLAKGVTVTDLDRNGVAEVTVPYMTFCGGGVDPGVLKIIMRQGETKFALRGENEILIPGYAPDGGKNTPDKALLLPENAVFKRHLDKVWAQVKVVD